MSAERALLSAPDPVVAPAVTPTEAIVARVWARELQLPRIGLDDDFIDLGSNSLQGAAIIARLEAIYGLSIPIRLLFEAPTVAELAAWIDRGRADSANAMLPVRVQAGAPSRPVFAIAGAGVADRELYRLGRLARETDARRPLHAFAGEPPLPPATPTADGVEVAAALHIAGMRAVQAAGPYLLLGICIGGIVAWEMARQLAAAGERTHLFLIDTRNLQTAPRREFRDAVWQAMTWGELKAYRQRRREWRQRLRADGLPARDEILELEEESGRRIAAARAYRPAALASEVTLVVNEYWHRVDATLGWGDLLAERLRVVPVTGSHGPEWNLPEIVPALQTWLREIDRV